MRVRDIWFNLSNGRAALIGGEQVYLFEVQADLTVKGPWEPEPEFRIRMWLQPSECRIPEIDAGVEPFEPLKQYIRQKMGVRGDMLSSCISPVPGL